MTERGDVGVARTLCLRYLARREYSRRELSQRLHSEGFTDAAINGALDGLADEGLVSDERFASSLLRRRAEQGYGIHRILLELQQLGVEESVVDTQSYDWDTVLERTYRKKYGQRKPESTRELASRQRFLLQRGFGVEQIRRLFRRLTAALDPS